MVMNSRLKYVIYFILFWGVHFTSFGKGISFRGSNIIRVVHYLGESPQLAGTDQNMNNLWKMYKKDKTDFNVQQKILLGMPVFSSRLTNRSELEKWQVRVENLFKDYWKNKPHEQMLNKEDLNIIMLYNQKPEKNSEPIEFLIQNFETCCSIVTPQVMLTYVAAYENSLINQLAKSGDINYKKELARLRGDLKSIFELVQTKSLSVEYLMTAKADALYALHREKDQLKYIELQREFLSKMGDYAGVEEYKNAVLTLMLTVGKKLKPEAAQQSLVWLDKALSFEVSVLQKVILVGAMGDCYLAINNQDKAKECFNQAYLLSLQLNDLRLQNSIRQKLNTISNEGV